jgi:ATP phosphoribosyltransferase regulatory subunit
MTKVVMRLSIQFGFADRPVGMRDGFPDFALQRRQLESHLIAFFAKRGFQLVTSGAFEYVETLLRAKSAGGAEDWVQWFDGSGRGLALRPEMTPSVARMAAPLVAAGNVPIRWCYAERVFRRTGDPASLSWASGRAAESTQVGIEWIGAPDCDSDAELLALCNGAISAVGVTQAQTVVSHALLVPALLRTFGVNEAMVESLLKLLTQGDYVGFRARTGECGLKVHVLSLLQSFNPYQPTSFEEALYTCGVIESLSGVYGAQAQAAWNRLVQLANLVSKRGLEDRVSFDVTLHRDIRYYTGVVFESFAPGVSAPVVLGGRYDDLLAQFGANAPAVGFTFEIERLMSAHPHLPQPAKEGESAC